MAMVNPIEDLTYGERLSLSRHRAKLSQTEMAARLGVSRQAIGKWEADDGRPEDIVKTTKEWAALTGFSTAWLLLGESGSGYNSDSPTWTPSIVQGLGQGTLALGLQRPDLQPVRP